MEKDTEQSRHDFIERLNAYHEAGHAVASYHVSLRFIRINLDNDPEMNNNPGILWDPNIICGPKFANDRQAWLNHQRRVLFIDFAGRAAEQFVRSDEVSFPTLSVDGINLLPLTQETAQSDLHVAWGRYHRIEEFKPCGHRDFIADFPDLLKRFEQEYQAVCSLLRQETHSTKIAALATVLLRKRRLTYDEAYATIARE